MDPIQGADPVEIFAVDCPLGTQSHPAIGTVSLSMISTAESSPFRLFDAMKKRTEAGPTAELEDEFPSKISVGLFNL